MKGPGNCADIGWWEPFSWPQLEAVHGSYSNYSRKFLASVDQLVADRWVLPSDGEKIKSEFKAKEARK
jgi:hypothetical protein